jgi:hypothetical protein
MLSSLFFGSFLLLPIAVGDSWRVTLLLWLRTDTSSSRSTRPAASVVWGWHQPTSHCVCPLNVCLFSGNSLGIFDFLPQET